MDDLTKARDELRQASAVVLFTCAALAGLSVMGIWTCRLILTAPGAHDRPARSIVAAAVFFSLAAVAAFFAAYGIRSRRWHPAPLASGLLSAMLFAVGTTLRYGRFDTMLLAPGFFSGCMLYWEHLRRKTAMLEERAGTSAIGTA